MAPSHEARGEAALQLAEIALGDAKYMPASIPMGKWGDVIACVVQRAVAACGAGFCQRLHNAELRSDLAIMLGIGKRARVLRNSAWGAVDKLLRAERFELRDFGVGLGFANGVCVDSGFRRALRKDVEGRIRLRMASRRESYSGEDGFKFTGADDSVDFRDILLDLVAVTLDKGSPATDDTLGFSAVLLLVLDHLEDGVDRLLLGRIDEAAGVDDDDFGVFGTRRQLSTIMVKQPHHDFGVDEVFSGSRGRRSLPWGGFGQGFRGTGHREWRGESQTSILATLRVWSGVSAHLECVRSFRSYCSGGFSSTIL